MRTSRRISAVSAACALLVLLATTGSAAAAKAHVTAGSSCKHPVSSNIAQDRNKSGDLKDIHVEFGIGQAPAQFTFGTPKPPYSEATIYSITFSSNSRVVLCKAKLTVSEYGYRSTRVYQLSVAAHHAKEPIVISLVPPWDFEVRVEGRFATGKA